MNPKRSLIKLLFGSIIAGAIVKYAAPEGVDPVPLVGQFFRDLVVNQTLTRIPIDFFRVDALLWLIILLLIALVPFMFALFSGIWGFFTYLSGFLSGYLLVSGYTTSDMITLLVGIFCLALGFICALYGEFIKG